MALFEGIEILRSCLPLSPAFDDFVKLNQNYLHQREHHRNNAKCPDDELLQFMHDSPPPFIGSGPGAFHLKLCRPGPQDEGD